MVYPTLFLGTSLCLSVTHFSPNLSIWLAPSHSWCPSSDGIASMTTSLTSHSSSNGLSSGLP